MDKFFLALVLGVFNGPAADNTSHAAPEAPRPVSAPALQPASAVSAAVSPSEDETRKRALAKAPASAEAARQARSLVRHERSSRERGKIDHTFTFPDGTSVTFTDRPKLPKEQANRSRVVFFPGEHVASNEPYSTFEAAGRSAGLSPDAIRALHYISQHEGGFDAINTWDSARFSWGFIQFAGGYGLRPALATFKERSPELFQSLLADYGVDVVQGEDGPLPVYVDPDSGAVLRGKAAEQAFGDDRLVVALFIRAGRVPEVKQRQLEAAIRDYAAPALSETHRNLRLSDVLRSPQGLAMLIDRKVQEGNVGRLQYALDQALIQAPPSNPADWRRVEQQVLDLAVQDADARTNIRELAGTASEALARAARAARKGQMALVPGGPSLALARASLQKALEEADYRMTVGDRRDTLRAGLAQALALTDPNRVATSSAGAAASSLESAAGEVRELVSRFRFEYSIRDRLRGIRASALPGPR